MEIKKTIGTKNYPTKFECKEFKGNKYIDLRNYYLDKKTGEHKPTRKGITLNKYKLQELVSFINDNKTAISNFFEDNNQEVEVKLDFKPLIGRKFDFQFENGKTIVLLDNSFMQKYSEQEILLIKNMLLFFYKSLIDTIDPNESNDEIESILNFLNNKLNRL